MSRRSWLVTSSVALLLLASWLYASWRHTVAPLPGVPAAVDPEVAAVGPFKTLQKGKWVRSFRSADGTIYLHGKMQSRDGGRTFESQSGVDVEEINAAPERATFARQGLFYALNGAVEIKSPGLYRVRGWRSSDNLKSLKAETVRVEVPQGPPRSRREGEWYGLYVYRTILEMPDGSWRLTMYGNFNQDELVPPDISSQQEVTYQMRSIILSSRDEGRSWQYLASIAAPRKGDPVGEGFVEPALTRLADGRLLSVMRTGHYFPLHASWSSDGGQSWTAPVYTGLDRGCDPAMITLNDGRVVMSWGRRFPEGWSRVDAEGDAKRFAWPGETILNLAVSRDGGASWVNHRIAQRIGTGYSSLFEVESNVLFVQTDQWAGRVTLRPRHTTVEAWRTAHARP